MREAKRPNQTQDAPGERVNILENTGWKMGPDFSYFVVVSEYETEDGGEACAFSVMRGDLDRVCTWALSAKFDKLEDAERYAESRNAQTSVYGLRLVRGGEA